MKTMKKSLSVLLSFLMVVTSVSICFTGLTFSAGAVKVSNDYKNVVVDLSKQTDSGTNYSYSADNGDVFYAVQNIMTSAKNTVGSSDSPADLLPAIFGSDTSSNAYKLALKLLVPGNKNLSEFKSSSSDDT